LKRAAFYGERAYSIAQLDKTLIPLVLVPGLCQWLGVVYSEISREVPTSQERRSFQNDALEMFQNAAKSKDQDATLCYQVALLLAEIGEVSFRLRLGHDRHR
jgi:hypothetical protein